MATAKLGKEEDKVKIEVEISERLEDILKKDIVPNILAANKNMKTEEEAIKALILGLLKDYARRNMVL